MRMPRQQKKTRVSGEDDSTGADTDGEEGPERGVQCDSDDSFFVDLVMMLTMMTIKMMIIINMRANP